MLVSTNDSGSIRENRCLKGFSRMYDRSRETADRDSMETDHLILLVQHQDDEVLSVCTSKVLLQHTISIGRTPDARLIRGHLPFPYQGHTINGDSGLFWLAGVFFA